MVARGFSVGEAVRMLRSAGHIAIGAAIGVSRDRAIVARGASTRQRFDEALAHFEPDQLPLIREGEAAYTEPVTDIAAELVRPLIESIARQRGEALPGAPG
jgi:hypothetical protein